MAMFAAAYTPFDGLCHMSDLVCNALRSTALGLLGSATHPAKRKARLQQAQGLRLHPFVSELMVALARHAAATCILRQRHDQTSAAAVVPALALTATRCDAPAQPDVAEGHANLASAYKDAARQDVAIASYRRALSLRPDFPEAFANLVHSLQARL